MTSQPRLTSHYRAVLLAHEAAATHTLTLAHAQLMTSLAPHLNALYTAIEQHQHGVTLAWLSQSKQLTAVKQVVTMQVDHFAALSQGIVGSVQQQAVTLGSQMAQAQVKQGVELPQAADASQLAPLVDATLPHSPRARLFTGFGTEAAQAVGKVVKLGISLGHKVKQIAIGVVQAIKTSLYRAITIVTTGMMDAFNGAAQAEYQANSDYVVGWTWITELSGNPCAACCAMHGSEHDLSEELDDHVGGHCSMAPIFASDVSGIGGSGGGGADMQTGAEWFDEQDEATQEEILGQGAYDLYAAGDVTLDDFVTVNDSPTWGKSIGVTPLKELVRNK